MNKKTAFVFIIIILIVAIPILIHFQTSEKNNIEPSEPTVKITDFVVDNQWSYLGGLVFDRSFNLTIENKEADNITDLELKVKVYANNSELEITSSVHMKMAQLRNHLVPMKFGSLGVHL